MKGFIIVSWIVSLFVIITILLTYKDMDLFYILVFMIVLFQPLASAIIGIYYWYRKEDLSNNDIQMNILRK